MRLGHVGAAAAVLAAVLLTAAPAQANQHIRKYATFETLAECQAAMNSYPGTACAQFGSPFWTLWGPASED
jgi:hypothetical protein